MELVVSQIIILEQLHSKRHTKHTHSSTVPHVKRLCLARVFVYQQLEVNASALVLTWHMSIPSAQGFSPKPP